MQKISWYSIGDLMTLCSDDLFIVTFWCPVQRDICAMTFSFQPFNDGGSFLWYSSDSDMAIVEWNAVAVAIIDI